MHGDEYAQQRQFRLYLAMTPDVHILGNYPFEFVHRELESLASEYGYTYIDLYPALSGMTPEDIWAMPGDPHPNALGHEKMADAIAAVLRAAG